MAQAALPADTTPEAYSVLVESWRSLSVTEQMALVDQITADVERLAIAGIRAAKPELSGPGIRHELARRRFGAALADEAYAPRPS